MFHEDKPPKAKLVPFGRLKIRWHAEVLAHHLLENLGPSEGRIPTPNGFGRKLSPTKRRFSSRKLLFARGNCNYRSRNITNFRGSHFWRFWRFDVVFLSIFHSTFSASSKILQPEGPLPCTCRRVVHCKWITTCWFQWTFSLEIENACDRICVRCVKRTLTQQQACVPMHERHARQCMQRTHYQRVQAHETYPWRNIEHEC